MSISEIVVAAFFAGVFYSLIGLTLWAFFDGWYSQILCSLSSSIAASILIVYVWPISLPIALIVWFARGRPGNKDLSSKWLDY